MKTLLAALIVIALSACTRQAESSSTAGVDFKIDRLFTHDGCTVYRFEDGGHNRYFTNCKGAVEWSDSYACGKSRCTRPDGVYGQQPQGKDNNERSTP